MGIRAFILAAAIGFTGSQASAEITVTTFNIRWYGLAGDMNGRPTDETRDPHLREFLFRRTQVGLSDVIAFQEIVDVPRLRRLMPGHQCVSYDAADPRHQHVVICVKKPLRFEIEKFDDNYAIEDIVLPIPGGKLRPAVHGLLKAADGRPIAHVIALHLKAMPEETRLRLQQIDILKRHIETKLKDGVPVVMTGDYNTHVKSATRMPKDDQVLFAERLITGAVPLKRVDNPFRYTYRTDRYASHFDHFWVSANARPLAPASVWIACNADVDSNRYEDLEVYNRLISDHCPVTVRLAL